MYIFWLYHSGKKPCIILVRWPVREHVFFTVTCFEDERDMYVLLTCTADLAQREQVVKLILHA